MDGQSKASSHLHFPFLHLILMTPPAPLPPARTQVVDRPNGSLDLKVAFYSTPGRSYLKGLPLDRGTRPHFTFQSKFQGNFLLSLDIGTF